ncbi:MAG: transglutaminase domain-containing protein [Acidaminococcaceae bacterium]
MKFGITHTTCYIYENPAIDNINEIRLSPRTNYRQSCTHHLITTSPNANLLSYEDYFGNRVHSFSISQPHTQLAIECFSIVVTQTQGHRSNSRLNIKDEISLLNDKVFYNRYAEFLLGTPYTKCTPDIVDFSKTVLDSLKGSNIYETVCALNSAIYNSFTYDPTATNVNTTAQDTLSLRRGVCQDFAHLMLACCRQLGIPARYVSGYHFISDLQTTTSSFQQASHAWIEAFIPGVGWLGFDPTNNSTINWRYIKLGHGRDYCDIVPVKGNYKALHSSQKMEVTVDVRKIEDESYNAHAITHHDKKCQYDVDDILSKNSDYYNQQQ